MYGEPKQFNTWLYPHVPGRDGYERKSTEDLKAEGLATIAWAPTQFVDTARRAMGTLPWVRRYRMTLHSDFNTVEVWVLSHEKSPTQFGLRVYFALNALALLTERDCVSAVRDQMQRHWDAFWLKENSEPPEDRRVA